jgi:hypothetical protein
MHTRERERESYKQCGWGTRKHYIWRIGSELRAWFTDFTGERERERERNYPGTVTAVQTVFFIHLELEKC